MANSLLLPLIAAGLAIAGWVQAEPADRSGPQPAAEHATTERVRLPGTPHEIDFGMLRSQPGAALRSEALHRAIIAWLSNRFDLPSTDRLPEVRIASAAAITGLRHTGALADPPRDGTREPSDYDEVVAVYDAPTKTIYLREGWTGGSPAELSVLVHEMVHHLQRSARIAYACDEERERLAFAAQEAWLGLFGHTLVADFEIDAFTVVLKSTCLFY